MWLTFSFYYFTFSYRNWNRFYVSMMGAPILQMFFFCIQSLSYTDRKSFKRIEKERSKTKIKYLHTQKYGVKIFLQDFQRFSKSFWIVIIILWKPERKPKTFSRNWNNQIINVSCYIIRETGLLYLWNKHL